MPNPLKLMPFIDWEPAIDIIPERRLLYGVLEAAVVDACDFKARNRVNKHMAKCWLFKPIRRMPEPFSCQWICEHLDLDPESLKRSVRQAIKAGTTYKKFLCSPERLALVLAA